MKILISLFVLLFTNSLFAEDVIIHPFQTVRSSGMGGVRYSTGLYDENFYSNPARACDNPVWKISLLDLDIEANRTIFDSVSSLTGAGDKLSKIGKVAGKNNHARIQTAMPAIYWPNVGGGKWSYGFGFLMSTQLDLNLRKAYIVEPGAIVDVGPAITVARKLMDEDRLKVGLNTHVAYRAATRRGFTLVDIIKGQSISPLKSGGEGAHVDFDAGATYRVHWSPGGVNFTPSFAINNILGGKYSNLHIKLIKTNMLPREQPRTFNVGVAASKETIWKFSNTMVAFEINDIGNNENGSMFRLFHIGGETEWGILRPRLGINQGYWAAGLGLNLAILEMNFATYGEELTLNPGGKEDRRYAFNLKLWI